jgi:hypothetical protein
MLGTDALDLLLYMVYQKEMSLRGSRGPGPPMHFLALNLDPRSPTGTFLKRPGL